MQRASPVTTRTFDKARAAGIEVVLMTPQLSPQFEAAPQRDAYLDYITRLASFRQVPVIKRYEMMKYWLDSSQMTEAEMIGADSGLGFMICNAWQVLTVETMYVGLLVIALLGFVFMLGLNALERWILPWKPDR